MVGGAFSLLATLANMCVCSVHMVYRRIRLPNICESDSRKNRRLLRGRILGDLFVDRHSNTWSPCLLLVPDQINSTGMTTYLNQSNHSGGCDWAACWRSRFRADPGPGPSFPPSSVESKQLYGSVATNPASHAAGVQQ
ncbi:hypothetical protein BDQ94DRAFT_185796 [Aspergillus welwitschiae]|uniref:Uncharacterized protein n=1 Tax=Aspergillus welwitschiae TaxID=1341132 RepID=A0A3F3Q9H0_9EURO|nr:hypothetical protein BDQ94DRAFT_185796 [Aspergillus welwitschiae]RDH35775.1 hypothetical protein BDQ94DRAFT_185796 [Aspergillus welwitschiae]